MHEGNYFLKTTHKSFVWLAATFALVASGMAFVFWSFRQVEDAALHRTQSRDLVFAADAFLSTLKDAQTGQHGYLLTGDDSHLQSYTAARKQLRSSMDALRHPNGGTAPDKDLDTLAAVLDSKSDDMDRAIVLRRNHDTVGALAQDNSGNGQLRMDVLRSSISNFIAQEKSKQADNDSHYDASTRRMFATIVCVGVLGLLFAAYFAYSSYRSAQQRLKILVQQGTQHLLEVQTQTNIQLQHSNAALQSSEQKLAVTLHSIGDAVIATDARACITLLNPVAEDLTGWTHAQALGRPVEEVFHIVNKDSRELATIPVDSTLAHGAVQGLANHTVLIARDHREFDIADSCAPIRDADGAVVGSVLVFRNVTNEYIAQQSLRDSSALVQTILNAVVDGIVTLHARGGIIESVNPAMAHMFGYSAAELAGKGFGLLIPELDQDQHNVSLDYYGVSDAARAVGIGREVMGRRKDGSLFPLEIAVSEMALRGQRYFTGILRDISARKQAEEALRKAGALQSAIFNSANFSSIATDARGVIQIFNVGAERMLGYAAADVMNKITPAAISDPQELIARASSLSTELGTDIAPGFDALVFKATRGIEDIYELTYIRKDGSRFPAVVSVTALRDDNDAIIGYLLIGTDNTARKLVEAERARLDQALKIQNVELETARAAAEKANLAKSEFLSSMSHELRSPLNAILGFAQLMESGQPAPTPTQAASIAQILKAGWYLLALINEILDLALIESGRLSMSMEPVSLSEVLLDCQTMMEPQATKRHIIMNFPEFSAPCFVLADRTRVKQVFVNLLTNAIKYNRSNGTVTVEFKPADNGRLHVSVHDTGEGLPAKKLSQLFQPFNRLGQEDSDEEGTGIGLVVSKRLVELMGGVIGARSIVGAGSEFWIELSLATLQTLLPDTGHAQVPIETLAHDGAVVWTLLYVEDNQANMDLVAQLVARRADLQLLRAADGMRGISMARAHLPDIILMDINLPGISGLQALKLLRDDPTTRHIPVLALSANAMPRDIYRGLEAGFFRYLTKPIKIGEFMLALDQSLALAQGTVDVPACPEQC